MLHKMFFESFRPGHICHMVNILGGAKIKYLKNNNANWRKLESLKQNWDIVIGIHNHEPLIFLLSSHILFSRVCKRKRIVFPSRGIPGGKLKNLAEAIFDLNRDIRHTYVFWSNIIPTRKCEHNKKKINIIVKQPEFK